MSTDLERHQPEAVDPLTMEMIDLATIESEKLVSVFLNLQAYERRAKEWRTAVEDELVKRRGSRDVTRSIGDYEVEVDTGWTREWDVEELFGVVADLVVAGHMNANDVNGLIKTERKVDGRKAQALLNRLEGEALKALRDCFQWKQKGRAKVKVTPVQQLEQ